MAEESERWVVAWNSSWLHDALFVRSLLESEGIRVLLANAIGGIRVLVRPEDQERAAEILTQLDSDPPP
jgi:hypothetical protein